MLPTVTDITEQCIDDLCDKVDKSNGRLDIQPKSETVFMTMRLIVALIFGEDFDYKFMTVTFKKLFKEFGMFMLLEALFGGLWDHKPFRKTRAELLGKIKEAIERRKANLSNNTHQDLITLMLLAQKQYPDLLNDDVIVDESLLFFFAGHDTTAITLAWSLYVMSRYPNVQQKLLEEANTLIPGDSKITTKQQLNSFVYTKAFIKETLRLFSPVMTLPRTVAKETKLGDVVIPAGQDVFLIQTLIMRDSSVWERAEEFDPTRFLDSTTGDKFGWMPFSVGPRNCIGKQLAVMELVVTISSLVKRFEVSRPPDQNENPMSAKDTYSGMFLVEPNPDLSVVLKKR